jgi:hypothetical protein
LQKKEPFGNEERVSHDDMQVADVTLVKADNADALEIRIKEGMDVDAVNGIGTTLLHVAARDDSVKCLRV